MIIFHNRVTGAYICNDMAMNDLNNCLDQVDDRFKNLGAIQDTMIESQETMMETLVMQDKILAMLEQAQKKLEQQQPDIRKSMSDRENWQP